jgi:hypothetical protein
VYFQPLPIRAAAFLFSRSSPADFPLQLLEFSDTETFCVTFDFSEKHAQFSSFLNHIVAIPPVFSAQIPAVATGPADLFIPPAQQSRKKVSAAGISRPVICIYLLK